MYFQLLKVIIWPRDAQLSPRVVNFIPGVVNVISGASKTGKSAIIPIVDYCLGASRCAIPVGVIRERASWFGVVVATLEGEKLFARREPGDQQSTGDMYVAEGITIDIPTTIPGKNNNLESAKALLNRVSGLTNLAFDPGPDSVGGGRPSFRDLVAFTFQPQNIVANPDVLFFKADTTEHREKLRVIFPYVLGAITADVLQARYELDQLARSIRRKEAELKALTATTDRWRIEAQGWLRTAMELGLIGVTSVPENWNQILTMLRRAASSNARASRPSLEGLDVTLLRLEELRRTETTVATELNEHRQRLSELQRFLESAQLYGNSVLVQRDRLAVAQYLRELSQAQLPVEPIVALLGGETDPIQVLTDALAGVELQLRGLPALTESLDRELVRRRGAAAQAMERLAGIRSEIQSLERNSTEVRDAEARYDRVERFIGKLGQSIELFERSDQSSELRQELSDLLEEQRRLQAIISSADIARRYQNALSNVDAIATSFVPSLDAEWPDAPIRLVPNDLTLKVLRGSRDFFLWEIGSGANWLAYHVAITLALQKYFLRSEVGPVPALLIYDQPSQVYFPKRNTRGEDDRATEEEWKDQDITAVRRIFELLSAEVRAADGRLQIIVLDHAHEDVWGGIPSTELIEEWRGSALIPSDWLKTT